MFNYFFHYYQSYGPLLIVSSVVLILFYWTVANFALLRATYRCVDLKNTVTGQVGKCFDSAQGTSCQNTELGYVYGWCNDSDNYGPLPGSKSGPYSGYCAQWSWNKEKCPPYQCMGDYPSGIDKQNKKLCQKKWGWCADKGVEKAMVGTPCGPRGGSCDNWIWEAKKCPTGCQKAPPVPLKKKCSSRAGKCQLVCGSRDDGNTLNCPPPACGKSSCTDKCICEGRPKDPWNAYENKQIRIRVKDGKAAGCQFKHASGKGGVAGVSSSERLAKFSCQDNAKADLMLLEKSKDGKFRVIDSDGCALQWSGRKGGNRAMGADERIAKFDCEGDAGDPFDLEGTPDDAKIYAKIKGQKCGLQWSSVKGHVSGVSRHERLAKFDCHDKADSLVVDMA
jgi:hypothetical protein